MIRRFLLGLAIAACGMGLHAQDVIPSPPSTAPAPPKVELTAKPETAKQDAPKSDATPASPASDAVTENYSPTFSERMAGFRDVIFRPISFSWFPDLTGSQQPLLPGDLEDPYWFKADMLFARFGKANAPALLTTSLPQVSRGILGNDGTSVLFGESISPKTQFGSRLTFGWWPEPNESWGFEGSFFFIVANTNRYIVKSNGDPLLAAPFFDVVNNQQSSLVIANEALDDNSLDQQSGAAHLGLTSRMYGIELNNVHNITRGTRARVDWTWGYRYLRFDEQLFNEMSQSQAPLTGQQFGTETHFYDRFGAENEFQGLNLGLRSQWWWNCWSFDVNGKLGLGATRSTISVYGQRQTAAAPQFQVVTTNGGIYALASNIGDETTVRFAVVPEIELGVAYQVTEHGSLTLHYNALAMTGVSRPGDQIDTHINPNILDNNSGNPANPVRFNNTCTLWVQTLSFGFEYRY